MPPRLSPSRSTSIIVRGAAVGTAFSAFFVICVSPCRTAVVRGPVTRPVVVLSGILGPIRRLARGEAFAFVLPMTAVLGADEPRNVFIVRNGLVDLVDRALRPRDRLLFLLQLPLREFEITRGLAAVECLSNEDLREPGGKHGDREHEARERHALAGCRVLAG